MKVVHIFVHLCADINNGFELQIPFALLFKGHGQNTHFLYFCLWCGDDNEDLKLLGSTLETRDNVTHARVHASAYTLRCLM